MSSTTRLLRDANRVPVMGGISSTDPTEVLPLEIDEATGRLLVFATGSGGGSIVTVAYDTIVYTDTSSTVDTYTYKTGGVSGVTVATVTITYTDSTKAVASTVVRVP